MSYNIDEIITLSDNREFEIINVVTINEVDYLYLKNMDIDQYTIVKVIEDCLYNLDKKEMTLVIENFYRSRWVY